MAVVPAVLVTAGVLVDFVMVSTGATTVKVADVAKVLAIGVVPFSPVSAPTGKELT